MVWPHRLGGHRGNHVGAAGWTAIADALERITSLACLNGYDSYAAICAGGLVELQLAETELAVAVARYLPRSACTLTTLNLRCALIPPCTQPVRTQPAVSPQSISPLSAHLSTSPACHRLHSNCVAVNCIMFSMVGAMDVRGLFPSGRRGFNPCHPRRTCLSLSGWGVYV